MKIRKSEVYVVSDDPKDKKNRSYLVLSSKADANRVVRRKTSHGRWDQVNILSKKFIASLCASSFEKVLGSRLPQHGIMKMTITIEEVK